MSDNQEYEAYLIKRLSFNLEFDFITLISKALGLPSYLLTHNTFSTVKEMLMMEEKLQQEGKA